MKKDTIILEWEDFCKRVLMMESDLSGVKIPEDPTGEFGRIIIVPKGLTVLYLFNACAHHFSFFPRIRHEDIAHDRDSDDGSYAIRVRDSREADKDLVNPSITDLNEQDIFGITLIERLLFELRYFDETGEHLDLQSETICSGSRLSDESSMRVWWGRNPKRLDIFATAFSAVGEDMRCREVIAA